MNQDQAFDQLFELTEIVHQGGKLSEAQKTQWLEAYDFLKANGVSDSVMEKRIEIMGANYRVNKALRSLTK